MDPTRVLALYLLVGLAVLALQRPLTRLAVLALRRPLTLHQELRLRRAFLILYPAAAFLVAAYAFHYGIVGWTLSCALSLTIVVRQVRRAMRDARDPDGRDKRDGRQNRVYPPLREEPGADRARGGPRSDRGTA